MLCYKPYKFISSLEWALICCWSLRKKGRYCLCLLLGKNFRNLETGWVNKVRKHCPEYGPQHKLGPDSERKLDIRHSSLLDTLWAGALCCPCLGCGFITIDSCTFESLITSDRLPGLQPQAGVALLFSLLLWLPTFLNENWCLSCAACWKPYQQ